MNLSKYLNVFTMKSYHLAIKEEQDNSTEKLFLKVILLKQQENASDHFML